MYNSYFGFKEAPFSLTPDPKYLYFSPNHSEAINHLLYGINERKGFILITGGIGAGKTTVCRALLDRLDNKTKSALILNSFISDMELLKLIVQEFEIEVPPEIETKKEYIDELNNFLLENYSNGGNATLLIDEAQNLSRDVLEQLRMLSNLETEKEKLIQIVLIGQPELRDIISSPSLKQLNERIVVRYNLMPLDYKDIKGYVEHRLIVAGGMGNLSFSANGYKKLHHFSEGNPRRINSICDRALLIAYTGDVRVISGNIIKKAVKDLYDFKSGNDPIKTRIKAWHTLSLVLLILLIFVVVFLLLNINKYSLKGPVEDIKKEINVNVPLRENDVEIREAEKTTDVILNEKDSISMLFSLFYNNEKSSDYYKDETTMSVASYMLSPEYYVLLKKPFRINVKDTGEESKYLVIISGNEKGATCLDSRGIESKVPRNFLLEKWGGIASWVYPRQENRLITKGVKDSIVLRLQESLNKLGYMIDLTGIYDDATFQVIKQFQKDFGLNPDGITGPRTRALLYQMAA
ncbi:AAA family ATPase [Thermodesulfobacteriota bacterium]